MNDLAKANLALMAKKSFNLIIASSRELLPSEKKVLENEKTGQILLKERLSGGLPKAGAFSNQFLEGMKQLYELEPFIKVKPYLTNQWEKNSSKIKRAS